MNIYLISTAIVLTALTTWKIHDWRDGYKAEKQAEKAIVRSNEAQDKIINITKAAEKAHAKPHINCDLTADDLSLLH
ncbi:hypothetical protein BH10PLA2_BH10PLA2_00850 [soil metagenome]